MPVTATTGQVVRPDGQNIEITSVRMHALAMWRWLYSCFPMPENGYPTPVVWARPMDAYGQLEKIKTSSSGQPFDLSYLNTPGVWPAQGRVPLISFNLTSLNYRAIHSFNLATNRYLGWANVGTVTDIDQLSSIGQTRYPTAWDYIFQVDFWLYRPDDMAYYVERLLGQLKLTSAGVPSVWIRCVYPGGPQLLKTYMGGNVEFPNDGADDRIQTFRVSVTLTMEGWRHDQVVIITPTLWYLASATVLGPDDTYRIAAEDLRVKPITNPMVLRRAAELPPLA